MKFLTTLFLSLPLLAFGQSSLTTIGGSDAISTSRVVINNNFTYLNNVKSTLSTGLTTPATCVAASGTNSPLLFLRTADWALFACTATNTWTQITADSEGSTGPADASELAYTPSGNLEGATVQAAIDELELEKQPIDANLTAITGLSTPGFVVKTGSGSATTRSIAVTSPKLSITNGDGASGNPTITIGSDVVDKTTTNTYTAGAKQIFTPNASTAGINLVCGALPSSPAIGDEACDAAASNTRKFWDGSAWQSSGSTISSGPSQSAISDFKCSISTTVSTNDTLTCLPGVYGNGKTQPFNIATAITATLTGTPTSTVTYSSAFIYGDPNGTIKLDYPSAANSNNSGPTINCVNCVFNQVSTPDVPDGNHLPIAHFQLVASQVTGKWSWSTVVDDRGIYRLREIQVGDGLEWDDTIKTVIKIDPDVAKQSADLTFTGAVNSLGATSSAPMTGVSSNPAGTCTVAGQMVTNTVNGSVWVCLSYSGTLVWTPQVISPFDDTVLGLNDDFLVQSNSTAFGNGNFGAGTQTVALRLQDGNHIGINRCTTGGTSGNGCVHAVIQGVDDQFQRIDSSGTYGTFMFKWIFRLNNITTVQMRCGLSNSISSWGSPGNGVWIKFDTTNSDTTWIAEGRNDAGALAPTMTGAFAPNASKWVTLTLSSGFSTAKGTVAFDLTDDSGAHMTATQALGTASSKVGAHCGLITQTGSAETYDLDKYAWRFTGMVR